MAGEELVVGLPASVRLKVLRHIELGRVVERLDCLGIDGFRTVKEFAKLFHISFHPCRQRCEGRCLVAGCDGVLKLFDRRLVQDEVELADMVEHCAPELILKRNPGQVGVEPCIVVFE